MKDLCEKSRCPRKTEKSTTYKEKSKWCAYHEDFGHLTDKCIGLRREIGYLLSKGHFKELFGRKKLRIQDPKEVSETASPPPADAQIIKFISVGSNICGTSFSSAKRHVKETKLENGDRPIRTNSLTNERIITFDEEDQMHLCNPHHDGLIITLFTANHYVRRILIDGGSSVNIIQSNILKKMNIPKAEITPRSFVLVGLSGETKNMLWIREMKDVSSTYHQSIKLPTPWGVVKMDSDLVEARNCYTSSMKPSEKQMIA
ncbi:uncharacterized protein LOC143593190 [Bidens hawaiensis]|uniref:uncharacterized protein LOC143593190 n=1 Tax=Bidens hawaiensis TaxID=980011 RepID=UPI004049C032